MDKHKSANLKLWNNWAKIHAKSAFYDVDGFKAGKSSLKPVEIEENGDVSGKTLLHLMCHIGLDTLSWARRGAKVTGIDFSEEAIKTAGAIAKDAGLEAEFLQSDIYELPDNLSGQFDIVFTSYGVLAWLPDLARWGEIIHHFLAPGGKFYMVEFHPFSMVFEDESKDIELRATYPYFYDSEPLAHISQNSYASPETDRHEPLVTYQWQHSMGDVINALINQGLQIEYLHEFDKSVYQMLPFMEERDGWWCLPESLPKMPLIFSLKAAKP